jgi:hypothetical protein
LVSTRATASLTSSMLSVGAELCLPWSRVGLRVSRPILSLRSD